MFGRKNYTQEELDARLPWSRASLLIYYP